MVESTFAHRHADDAHAQVATAHRQADDAQAHGATAHRQADDAHVQAATAHRQADDVHLLCDYDNHNLGDAGHDVQWLNFCTWWLDTCVQCVCVCIGYGIA